MRGGAGGEPGRSPGSQSGQGASAALLRLREADVVRLCGLRAAAEGLEYASRHAVTQSRRAGARLLATVLVAPAADPAGQSDPIPCEAWCEVVEAPPAPLGLRWGCARDATTPATPGTPGTPGCAHVAALLTAWVRAPGEFRALADDTPTALAPGAAPPGVPHPSSARAPATPVDGDGAAAIAAPARSDAHLSLADELRRLPAADAQALARRLTNALDLTINATPADDATTSPVNNATSAASDAPAIPTGNPSLPAGAIPTLPMPNQQSLTEAEARAQAAAILSDPQRVSRVVARLDPDAQSLLNDTLLLGGSITAADLHALGERAGRASAATQNAMGALERFGLVFRVVRLPSAAERPARGDQPTTYDVRQAWRRVTGWRVAPEVRAALPMRLATPTDETTLRHAARVRIARASPRPLCLGLALLARARAPLGPFGVPGAAGGGSASRERKEPTQAPQSHTRPAQATQPHTSGAAALTPGDLAPTRLAELARGAGLPTGLLRMARRVLLWAREQAPGQPLTDLASAPSSERALALRAGFRLWRNAESAADLVDLDAPDSPVRMRYDLRSPAFRPAALATEAAEARAFVVALLTHAEPGIWYTFDDLLNLVWRINPLFLRGRQQAYTLPAWRLERASDSRPLRPTVRDEWLVGEGAYLRALLTGPLHWWGALDLLEATPTGQPAQSASTTRAIAFRLTDLGVYLLMDAADDGRGAKAATEALAGDWGAPLLLTGEGALAAHPLAASASQLNALSVWARVTSIAGGRLIYTLSADLACAAFDRGQTPADAVASVQATGRVAERMLAQLQRWRARYGDARIEAGWALLEARDEAALREALAYAPAIAARARLLAPTLALVHPTDLAAFRAILARKSYIV